MTTHQHWMTGEPCTCGFTTHLKTARLAKTASKLDWLRERPDMQAPEKQPLLRLLEHYVQNHGEKVDPLLPWIAREVKKGRLHHKFDQENWEAQGGNHSGYVGHLYYKNPVNPNEPNGSWEKQTLDSNAYHLGHWADWFHSGNQNPTRRGVDIMQLQYPQMRDKIAEWDEHLRQQQELADQQKAQGGEVVHQYPDNWTLRKLTDPASLRFEGDAMGHCVGGYDRSVQNGDSLIYSLRDPQHQPHATMEITPRSASENPYLPADQQMEPSPHGGTIVQIQGKSNEVPKPEYQQRLKQWFQTFPEETRPNWNLTDDPIEHIGGIDPEAETYNASWDGVVRGEHNEEGGGYGPHGDYGLVTPHRAIDYPSVIQSLIRPRSYSEWNDTSRQEHDPDEVGALYKAALGRGEIPQLADAAERYQDWANEDLNDHEDRNFDYLSPYPGEDVEDFMENNPGGIKDDYGRWHDPETPEEWEDAFKEAQEHYDSSRQELYDAHQPSKLTDTLNSYLRPHYTPNGYTNEITVPEGFQHNAQRTPLWLLPAGTKFHTGWGDQRAPYTLANKYPGVTVLNDKGEPEPHWDRNYIPAHITVPPQDGTTAKVAKRLHKNPWGEQCTCPWFSPEYKEHVGSIVKEAAKLDWLRERPDVKKDLVKHLIVNHHFPYLGERADPLLPWLLREHTKGRVQFPERWHASKENADDAAKFYADFVKAGGDPQSEQGRTMAANVAKATARLEYHTGRSVLQAQADVPTEHGGRGNYTYGFSAQRIHSIADMLDDLARRRQGVDLMKHTAPELLAKNYAWEQEQKEKEAREAVERASGQLVHKFPDNGWHKGWHIRRLRNKEDASLEGERMGHCVGGYGSDIEGGHTNIYSLRDEKNEPHATIEIKSEGGRNPSDPTEWVIPDHAWLELPPKFQGVPMEDIERAYHHEKGWGAGSQNIVDPAVYQAFMAKAVGHPPYEHGIAHPPLKGGEVVQTQGKSNENPLEEYTEMLDEWMQPHGLQSFKPWWDNYYVMPGPENVFELMGHNGEETGEKLGFGNRTYPRESWDEGQPHDFQAAESDADQHGVEPPELRVEDPNYKKIVDSLIDHPHPRMYGDKQRAWHGYNPDAGQYVFEHARDNNQLDDLREAFNDHWDEARMEPFKPTREQEAAWNEFPTPWQRSEAQEKAEREYYEREYGDMSDWQQLFNHLGPLLHPNYQPYGYPRPGSAPVHPDQQQFWNEDGDRNYPLDNQPFDLMRTMQEQPTNVFSKVAAAPLYYRWVFSPVSAEVELAHNGEGHPTDVRYHGDLANNLNEPGLVHGYAYRIGGGWRLTDWDHRPVEDPFVVAQVMRKLRSEDGQKPAQDGAWEPAADDFSRMHLGMPSAP